MEAFSTQGNGTMTIVKEKSPTSFEVEQNLKTWPSNGARTIAFDSKTGHLFAMASEAGPPPPPRRRTPPPAQAAGGRPRRRDPRLLHDHHGRQIGPGLGTPDNAARVGRRSGRAPTLSSSVHQLSRTLFRADPGRSAPVGCTDRGSGTPAASRQSSMGPEWRRIQPSSHPYFGDVTLCCAFLVS